MEMYEICVRCRTNMWTTVLYSVSKSIMAFYKIYLLEHLMDMQKNKGFTLTKGKLVPMLDFAKRSGEDAVYCLENY